MKRRGISLITLVITIVIIIILAGAVILNLSDSNPIKSAKKANVLQNIDTFKTELALKLTTGYTNGIFDTENINAVTKEDILKYIPSMKDEKIGKALYTDILVVSEGQLKVDGTKANECVSNGKLTQEEYEWLLEAIGGNVFNVQTYAIKYYINDGTENFTESSKIHDVSYSILPMETVRDGYGFKSWNTNADGTGDTYNVGDEYIENQELTLYAQWEAGTYTVTYYKNDGTEEAKTDLKTQDVPYEIIDQNFTREGYTFVGFNTSQDGTGTDYAVGSSYVENNGLELYAKWEIITYSITYYKNDGTTESITDTKNHGDTYTIKNQNYVKDGYTFVGYNTSKDGNGIDYIVDSSYVDNVNLELYAKWEINTYNIIYNANNGTNAPSSQTKTYGVTLKLSTSIPTRTGYTFDGWNTKSDGTGINYASGSDYTTNEDLTLYAKWKANGISASIIKSNSNKYYGAYVNYTPSNGCPGKWRILYTDSTHIYLISENIIPNSYLSSAGFRPNGDYKVYDPPISSMLESSNYTGFKDVAGKASSVVAGPTIEQFVSSYNAVNTAVANQINYLNCTAGQRVEGISSVNANGYVIRFENSGDYLYGIKFTENVVKRDLYLTGNDYWLASKSANHSSNLVSVGTGPYSTIEGMGGSSAISYGLRPVITLNTNVQLIDPDGDGIYDLQ